MIEPNTRERIRELIQSEPMLNMSDIAARVGVSRERVRQIVRQEALGITTGQHGVVARQPDVVTGGVSMRVGSTAIGTIGELLAAADLVSRGFMVFFPLIRTAACDLITLTRQGLMERIEVRCGKRLNGGLKYSKLGDRSACDRYAIVVTGEPVAYSPPF